MQAKTAIKSLQQLKAEAGEATFRDSSGQFTSWKSRVRSVLTRALGKDHHVLAAFEDVRYDLSMFTERTPSSAFEQAFRSGVQDACGIIDAAIFELQDAGTSDDAVDETTFDPELWSHVQNHIRNEDWQAVASQTAIFIEDRVRQWCGDPKGRGGETLVGKGLYAKVFANDGQYRLGKEPGEWEGWRALSTGFAQALSNVDRHNIQKRDDAKRYAFGVLGLGSLILTQLRYQHGDDIDLQ